MKESKEHEAAAAMSKPTNTGSAPPPQNLRSSETTLLQIVERRIQGYKDLEKEATELENENDSKPQSCMDSSDASILQIVEQRIRGYHYGDMDQKLKEKQDKSSAFAAAPSRHDDDQATSKYATAASGTCNVQDRSMKTSSSYLSEEQQQAKAAAAAQHGSAAHGAVGKDGEHDLLTKDAAAVTATKTPGGVPTPVLRRSTSSPLLCHQPGAYQDTPGTMPVRAENLRYSVLGRHLDPEAVSAMEDWMVDNKSTELSMDTQQLSSTNTSGTLSVATPVVEPFDMLDLPLPIAEEYEHATGTTPAKERKKMMCGLSIIILVIAGVTLLVVLRVVNNDSQDGAIDPTETAVPTTIAPTLSSRDYVLNLLPNSTLREIELHADTAPQAKALQWILEDPQTPDTYPPERIQQRFALANLYYATNGDNWSNNSGWLDYDSHECSWFSRHWFEDVEMYMSATGAQTFLLMYDSPTHPCSENTTGGDFEHLWLYRNQLEGTLPFEELALLTSLKSMSLFNNAGLEITLSSELGRFTKLEGIEVSAMTVDGSIPTEIGLLTNLRAILASNNRITGTIPSEYGLLTNMVYSILSENIITGSLPSELGGMSALEWFYLYGNQASGTIPTELFVGRSTTMQLLNMFANQFTGTLPTEIGLLTNIVLMALADNEFTGYLPSELGQLTTITSGVSFDRNRFRGTIPTELGNLRNITGVITGSGTYGLGLSGNQFTGLIPSELGMLSLLERISLQDNFLTGTLQSELAGMVTLQTFDGQKNNFTGLPVPDWTMVLRANRNESLLEEWDTTGNPFLSGVVPAPLCGIWKFDCSSLLCGCDCPCPAS
jgi:hypothetical protein